MKKSLKINFLLLQITKTGDKYEKNSFINSIYDIVFENIDIKSIDIFTICNARAEKDSSVRAMITARILMAKK